MDLETLMRRHPRLYHLAEPDSIESIRQHGLLSTSALLDLFEISALDRVAIERRRRPTSVELSHPQHRRAVIRDQHPLNERKLQGCLQDQMTVEEWLLLLNGRVYFWVSEQRVSRLREAALNRNRGHRVLVFDTAKVVTDYEDRVTLAAMNTGTTSPMAFPRGRNTYRSIEDYPYEDRRRRRLEPLIEFSIKEALLDVDRYLVDVQQVG